VTRPPARPALAGFTLLEIAVALAVLGAGVVTCLQLFSGSLQLQSRASRQSRAVLAARAAMDAVLATPEIRDHSEERVSGEGFRTKILVRHAGAQDGIDKRALDAEGDRALRFVQVDVVWEDGTGAKSYTLKSLRIAPEND